MTLRHSEGHGRRWLSKGVSALSAHRRFDVVIVGSGYGGAVAARKLAGMRRPDGTPLSVCVLERGREYLPGDFPADVSELPRHVRSSASREGLFDFIGGPDVGALMGSGLGGGSLINAGVMIRPTDAVLDSGWPSALDRSSLAAAYCACESELRAEPCRTIPKKYQSLARMHPDTSQVAISVSNIDQGNLAACTGCGNCATGCNFGAKASLDVTHLARACAAGADVFTGVEVDHVVQLDDAGGVDPFRIVYRASHDIAAKQLPDRLEIRAAKVILAAGTFGSTGILMRSRDAGLQVSAMLGQKFSANGDMLAVGYNQTEQVNAIAATAGEWGKTGDVGPTITGKIDLRGQHFDGDCAGTDCDCRLLEPGILLEEMAVPFPLRSLFAEVFKTADAVQDLVTLDTGDHVDGAVVNDPLVADDRVLGHTSIYALMGDDGAKGRILLNSQAQPVVDWPGLGNACIFSKQRALLNSLQPHVGGRMLMNPLWRPLPEGMDYLTEGETGPAVTVHPLGGCSMADNGSEGVVNHLGQVFTGAEDHIYKNLVVLDGAIIPKALGANPALTIAALAWQAVDGLVLEWGLLPAVSAPAVDADGEPASLPDRPVVRRCGKRTPPVATRLHVRERMAGLVTMHDGEDRLVELTLDFEPAPLTAFVGEGEKRIVVSPGSRVRIFDAAAYEALVRRDLSGTALEQQLDELAQEIAQVSGTLYLFRREKSCVSERVTRAFVAWLLNRGIRDSWDSVRQWWRGNRSGPGFLARFRGFPGITSRSGEVRTLEYELTVSGAETGGWLAAGDTILGRKRLTYGRAANPLRQLMEMRLDRFPGMARQAVPVLMLDPRYLARIGHPLISIDRQADTVQGLVDLLRLLGFVARLFVSLHSWTFRLPDRPETPPLRRLPDRLPGIGVFEQYTVPATDGCDVLLTRYARPQGKPVMCLHGYSASGTTFAHSALTNPAARYLWDEGRDVWIVDLRTSAGLPSATIATTFETVAEFDIPAVVRHINGVNRRPLDVIAHCMGSAMFSMSVLDGYLADCEIGRVALTQVGPGVVFSPANIIRAYLLEYFRHYMPLGRFDFRPAPGSLADNLLDRLLNVLPYPEHEWHIENPAWPPWRRTEWVGHRHRMDLLYGRDFSLKNVQPGFLAAIDAQFGPLNLDTVSQVIQFTRWKNIATRQGRNVYYQRRRLERFWTYETLSLHGEENGLSDVSTLDRNRQVFLDAGVPYATRLLEGYGHQDLWVSATSHLDVFPLLHRFLDEGHDSPPATAAAQPLLALPPHLGPVVTRNAQGRCWARFGHSPNLSVPVAVVLVTLAADGTEVTRERISDVRFDGNGMTEVALSTDRGAAQLIVLLYDESPALVGSTFGDPGAHQTSTDVSGQDDTDDAVSRLLACDISAWRQGVVELPGDETLLLAASCQYPASPLDRRLAYEGWQVLADSLDAGEEVRPSGLLLMGDLVYVDATLGIFNPVLPEDRFTRPHVDLLGVDPVQQVLRRIPAYAMLDDHELENDWSPARNAHARATLQEGTAAFRSFQAGRGARRDRAGLWCEVDGEVQVFMMNTRTDRQPRLVQSPYPGIVSDAQLAALGGWLARSSADRPRVISMASVPFPRRVDVMDRDPDPLLLDGFDGYPGSRRRLLEVLMSNPRNVLLVSGDEHLPMIADIVIWDENAVESASVSLTSVHCAPLYAPMAFANGCAHDFLLQDRWQEEGLDIEVQTQCLDASPGFTRLAFRQEAGVWVVEITFPGGDRITRTL